LGFRLKCSPLFALLCILSLISENAVFFLLHMGALLLHEGAHFIMARMLGCHILQVKLLPYGCRMEIGELNSPWDELMIALSGPVCSFICFMGCKFIPGGAEFAKANMYIALINLLPAFPLDGGRALNSFFTMIGIAPSKTMRAAMTFIFAAATGVCGYIIKNATLTIFAVFLFSEGTSIIREQTTAATAYMRNMRCAATGRGISVRHIALRKDVTLGKALGYIHGGYSIFCILDENMCEIARIDGMKITEFAAKFGINTQLCDIIPYIDHSK